MKVIIIDATAHEVREAEVENTLAALQAAVGGFIELVELPEGEDLFVNEEGLLSAPAYFFTYAGAHQPFAGNGIITGSDGQGGQADTRLSAQYVRDRVKFMDANGAIVAAQKIEQGGGA